MKTVAYHNLGCKVNSYEMDAMIQALRQKGYRIVPFEEKADIYIVNTCTVTNIADRKSRQMLHKAKKTNPEGIVVAVGCYVQSDAQAVEADSAVDLLIGNNRKKNLVEILESYFEGVMQESVIDINHTSEYEEMQLTTTAEHTRAYIKIQDGCNQFCTYCMIPYARGRVRSRRKQDVLREIEGLAAAGYKEFVLTGIHISSYGMDFKEDQEENLLTLVQAIDT
ncbi:MAG: radical SAM protein, partial [Lachnospiraceae bacterium]|nr:radical SAM protein [Lachnospiraceae bacterium]